jgi:hypothetical protein
MMFRWLVPILIVVTTAFAPVVGSAESTSDPFEIPTLHASEIGYETFGPKRALLQTVASAHELPAGTSFQVRDAAGNTVLTGTPGSKQTKWGRDFWPIDFSSISTAGTYQLEVDLQVAKLTSSTFAIGDTPLLDAQMFQVAVKQLDERYPSPMISTAPYYGAYLPSNASTIDDVVYSNSPDTAHYPFRSPKANEYVPRIWRDCSSNYTEVESAGTSVLALIDLYSKVIAVSNRFDTSQMEDLVTNVQRGVDYFVALQESHPGDPLRNGRLRHSLLVNVFDGGWWAGNVHLWHDTVFGTLVLARGSAALSAMAGAATDPARRSSLGQSANAALNAAKAAWNNANTRPYYLPEDLDTSFIPGYSLGNFWPWTDWRAMARAMYGVTDPKWDMAETLRQVNGFAGLRSRELISFLNASTALYRLIHKERAETSKYLVTARAIAAELMRRQYGSIESPLDGVVGMFHEFSAASGPARDSFLLESAQAGMTHIGNYDFTSLRGFIDLLSILPADSAAAEWHRTVQLWAKGYQEAAATHNPLGLPPATVYRSPQGNAGPPAVYWFGNHLHGGNEIPGQAAHSLLEVGNYLNDVGFYRLAVNDVQFYAGVNAGIGEKHQPSSLIKGIGVRTLVGPYMEASAPVGSVANGYSSTGSFSPSFYADYDRTQTIPADGFGEGATTGQESWIMHSHSYVMGAVAVEAPFTLTIKTRFGSKPLAGVTVQVEYPANGNLPAQTFTTDSSGSVTIRNAVLGQSALVRLSRPGFADYVMPLATVGGDNYTWAVDYRNFFTVKLVGLPTTLSPHTTYPVTLLVEDFGAVSDSANVTLSFAGLESGTTEVRLAAGRGYNNVTASNRQRRYDFLVTSGAADQAYVLHAYVAAGANTQIMNSTGSIQASIARVSATSAAPLNYEPKVGYSQ